MEIVKVRHSNGNTFLTVPRSIRALLKSQFMEVRLENHEKIVYTPVRG